MGTDGLRTCQRGGVIHIAQSGAFHCCTWRGDVSGVIASEPPMHRGLNRVNATAPACDSAYGRTTRINHVSFIS
jgi:hypothetical protein